MHVLIVVPARGGSKGLPGKNLKPVAGVSLVGRAVIAGREFAQRAGINATVFVDTDSQDIADEGRRYGAVVPFLRPAELAVDTTSTSDSVLHAVSRFEAAGTPADAIVLLQPTSPLRVAEDIVRCWAAFDAESAPSVISTMPVGHPPELSLRTEANGVVNWALGEPPADTRRQAFRPSVLPNGAVYVLTLELLRRERRFIVPGVTRAVLMPPERSVDIDTAGDLAQAEALATQAAVRPVAIGPMTVARDQCRIIADAGDVAAADAAIVRVLVDSAADAGADAIRLFLSEPTAVGLANLHDARQHAALRGLAVIATAGDQPMLERLDEIGVDAFHVVLGNAGANAILARAARAARPILISTGAATFEAIVDAMMAVRGGGDVSVALLHGASPGCTGPLHCNLRVMDSLRALFGVPVGWGDETSGSDIALAAVACGAALLETRQTGHHLTALVSSVRSVRAALGDGVKALPWRAGGSSEPRHVHE